MDIWHSMDGMVSAVLISADISGALTAISAAGIVLHGVENQDELTVRFSVRRRDYRKLRSIVDRRGDELHSFQRKGLYWLAKGMLKHPVLLIGIATLLFLVTFLPTRVLFIRVEGNTTIPTNLILEKCAECGIQFGASRREVRSEKLKNAILEAIPELQWAGINTSGCTATVSVHERSVPTGEEKSKMVGSIVALRDGIITELTVTRGSAACKIGQAVRKGQTLISGYTDCGLTIRAEQADGEVFAQTQQSLTAKIPSQSTSRGEIREENKKYSLIIGKKRINLYKGSGISDTGCVKIYSVGYITLPGGFQLPVAIVTERFIYYDTNESFLSQKDGTQILSDFARQYLNSHMVAGQILTKTEDYAADGSCLYLTGNYACLEMIGIMRSEENIKAYGEHD